MSVKIGVDDLIVDGQDPNAQPRMAYTPVMGDEAYHGLAGAIVRTIEPHSEADPVAILMHVLVGAGNAIGRGPHALVEQTAHHCNENVALVGQTSKGRKGQSWSTPSHLLAGADEPWMRERVVGGLSSGEGVIYNVRDARYEQQPVKERGQVVDYQQVLVDEGIADKRLLVVEPELAVVLKRMAGDTNSLSSVLRQAWESGTLRTLTKNSPLRATDAHISIIAHITMEELKTSLTETERANGFGNRFMFMSVSRSKVIPEPEPVPDAKLVPLTEQLRRVIAWAQTPRRLVRDAAARAVWAEVYPDLSEGEAGLIGAMLGRAEAHVLRLSLIYAALDCSPVVTQDHLMAAMAVWEYAEASARRIFSDAFGITVADTILQALRTRGPMTRDQIRDLFQRNKSADEINAALSLLLERKKVRMAKRPPEGGTGRPAEVWEAIS